MNLSAGRSDLDWTDKYNILSVLKDRKDTKVCLAEHIRLKQKRIIKTVCGDSSEAAAVLQEAVLMRQLKHPCIPEIYDIEEHATGFSIIEEYIPGDSLTSYCRSQHPEIKEIISYAVQLCGLLDYLHNRKPALLHLDLKPDNLIVCGERLFLIDFGSAKEAGQVTFGMTLTGTPGYAAPECYRGQAVLQSDIYSTGKILEFMLASSPLRCGRKYAAWRRRLLRIVKKAKREKPSERYLSASAMERVLLTVTGKDAAWEGCRTISIASCTRRTGATWISLLFASFLQKQKKKVLYLECNESDAVLQMIQGQNITEKDIFFQGIPVAEARGKLRKCSGTGEYGTDWEKEYYEKLGYKILLEDFGVLTPENIEAFLEADLCLFLVGSKIWEQENMWKGLSYLSRFEKVPIILVNFAGKKEYARTAKLLGGLKSLRIPYVAEAWEKKENKELWEVFEELYDQLAEGR